MAPVPFDFQVGVGAGNGQPQQKIKEREGSETKVFISIPGYHMLAVSFNKKSPLFSKQLFLKSFWVLRTTFVSLA